MCERLKNVWFEHRRIFVICMLSALVWGLIAHAYPFLNFQYSHDSLDGIYTVARDNFHKIELGRVLVPAYRHLITGNFSAPWLMGFLGLTWIALGAFVVVSLFDIHKPWLIILVCGFMTANQTVIAQSATYLHDLDPNMFGMFMSCVSAWCWHKRPRGWVAWSVLALIVSLGMYQSYVSMTIGLMMIMLILRLVRGEKASSVLRDGLWAAGVVLLSGVLFLLLARVIMGVMDIPLAQRDNSLSALSAFSLAKLPEMIVALYQDWWRTFVHQPNTWLVSGAADVLHAVVIGLTAIALLRALLSRALNMGQKALMLLLVLLLPLAFNLCYVLTSGGVHHTLMKYAFALMYLLCLLLMEEPSLRIPAASWISAALSVMLLFSFVQTANNAYFKKTTIDRATYSRMTMVMHDMLGYGYIPGETPLVVEGAIELGPYPGYEEVSEFIGMMFDNALGHSHKAKRYYFSYVLGDNANFLNDEEWLDILEDDQFEGMPVYPDPGYVDYIGDVMVVRLS